MKPARGRRPKKARITKNAVRNKRVAKPKRMKSSERKKLRDYIESASTSVCSTCTSDSCQSKCSARSDTSVSVRSSRSDHRSSRSDHRSLRAKKSYYKTYQRIKTGLRRSIPAAIVLWAFHKMPSTAGLTSRRVINFLKRHYRVIDDPRKTGKSISSMLRCACEFGLIEKRGNRYYLATRNR